MTKINKINVNGNVYDIQDNSSGYVKEEEITELINESVETAVSEINVPTKVSDLENDSNFANEDYVNEKFDEAIAMGFKVEVVEALPTENISHQVIYLVLNGDDEEENVYDEYIYTSENVWEMIGSTKTDLTDYYTKEEVDNAINNIDTLPIYTITYNDKSAETLEKISKIITESLGKRVCIYIKNAPIASDSSFVYSSAITDANAYPQFITNHSVTDKSWSGRKIRISVTGKWTDGVYTASAISYDDNTSIPQALAINNTSSYTPTGDYNPATKKYVDDSIANIDIPSSIIIDLKYDNSLNYNLDENKEKLKIALTNSYENNLPLFIATGQKTSSGDTGIRLYYATNYYGGGIAQIYFYEVAPRKLSSQMYQFLVKLTSNLNTDFEVSSITFSATGGNRFLDTQNTSSYTPANDYHPATKKYVDDSVAGIDIPQTNRINTLYISKTTGLTTEELVSLDGFINDSLEKGTGCIIEMLSTASTGASDILYSDLANLRLDGYSTTSLRFSTMIYTDTRYVNNYYRLDLQGTYIDGVWETTTATITRNNGKNYAEKSYVDNSISTALGDVNTILATLTTVEEGE